MSRLHKGLLEVERKFSNLRMNPLTIDGGAPYFRSLQNLGQTSYCDVYFDRDNALSQAGTWVRTRNGKWQSKVRRAGDFTNSQFQEIEDLKGIQQHVESIIATTGKVENAFGLAELARLTTSRTTWLADGKFKVVLDCTDFGHTVGEVELEEQFTSMSDEEIKHKCYDMDAEIQSFMQRYAWAFDQSPPVGKLTAFFALQKARKASTRS